MAILETNHSAYRYVQICAQSNLAVDEVLSRLIDINVKINRFGNRCYLSSVYEHKIRPFSLDHLVHTRIKVSQSNKNYKEYKRQLLTELLTSQRSIEGGTLASYGSGHILNERVYDLTVVDESAQTCEPAILGVACGSQRLCLVGDHKQLPPCYREALMQRSLLERLEMFYFFVLCVDGVAGTDCLRACRF